VLPASVIFLHPSPKNLPNLIKGQRGLEAVQSRQDDAGVGRVAVVALALERSGRI